MCKKNIILIIAICLVLALNMYLMHSMRLLIEVGNTRNSIELNHYMNVLEQTKFNMEENNNE